MKAAKKNNALEGIKKEQLKRRVFTLEFKAEVVRHRKAENLSLAECGRKFGVLPKLIQQWEKQYEAGQLTAAAQHRSTDQPPVAGQIDSCVLVYHVRVYQGIGHQVLPTPFRAT